MKTKTFPAVLVLAATAAIASCKTPPTPAATPSSAEEQLAASITSTMNPEADPCVDFYEYACGGWLAATEIPADKPAVSRGFTEIADRTEKLLRRILEESLEAPGGDPDRERIGAAYAACMDTDAIDALGTAPLAPLLARVDAVTDPASLMTELGHLQWAGVNATFTVAVAPDYKNPELNILMVEQGGLGLPEREYYLSEDFAEVRAAYEQHVTRMFRLLGDSEEVAAANAKTVLALETKLAEISTPIVDLRDPDKTWHKLDRDGLQALTPSLPWTSFLASQGYDHLTQINVTTPPFFEGLEKLVHEVPMDQWRTYLRWWVITSNAEGLSSDVVAENFDFYGKTLSGARQDRDRWKKCVAYVDGTMGEVLGKIYVERYFAGDSKEVALDMIQRVEGSLKTGFGDLAWMDDPTRAAAGEKMGAILNKIGYPDQWRDYSTVSVSRTDHFGNTQVLRGFEAKFWMDQAEKPVDEKLWYMSPPTVNAYYNPLANEIVFPAGILQAPFFDRSFPKAMNFGAMGMVMGHEVTHGFDDSGRKFDAEGRLREWWAPEVAARFEERAQCVRDLYSTYEVLPGVKIDGALTAGENIADIGGIKHAYGGYEGWVAEHAPETAAGFTGDQLFFVAYAQSWCTKRTPELERVRAATDEHSTPRFRVNGPLSQLPEFAEAFACDVGEPMRPEKICEVW